MDTEKQPVHHEDAGLVEFVLDGLAANWHLNDDVDVVWWVFTALSLSGNLVTPRFRQPGPKFHLVGRRPAISGPSAVRCRSASGRAKKGACPLSIKIASPANLGYSSPDRN